MSIDFDALTEEQKMLLLGLGVPALMEIRLLELDGAEAVVDGRGRAQHGASGPCNLTRTHGVLRGCSYAAAVGEFLVKRGLLEQVHEGTCPHVRLTAWGQEFVQGCVKNTVMAR